MPYSIYASLNLYPLEEIGVIMQMAVWSNIYPRSVVEDVLVQVNELVFSVDFYVLDMEDEESPNPTPILLGRPFLKMAQAMINVYDGILTMEFDREVIKFSLFKAMRYPSDRCDELQTLSEELYCEVQKIKIQRQSVEPLSKKKKKLLFLYHNYSGPLPSCDCWSDPIDGGLREQF